jgi:ATP-dependent Clp protease protease subunit
VNRWYEFRAQAKGAEIVIYDEIGAFGIPAKAFLDELKALGPIAELTVRINSPGGSVFDGVAIYNALKRHDAMITVRIDGIAASIASVIAMAGDEVVMPENAMLMLHDPSGLVVGTATDMRAMAEALDKMKAGMVAAYRAKSGRDDVEIEALMAAETWLSAQEALELSLADRIEQPVRMAAHFDFSRFRNTPPQLAAILTSSSPQEDDVSDSHKTSRASLTPSQPRPPAMPLPRRALSSSRRRRATGQPKLPSRPRRPQQLPSPRRPPPAPLARQASCPSSRRRPLQPRPPRRPHR